MLAYTCVDMCESLHIIEQNVSNVVQCNNAAQLKSVNLCI